MSDFSPGVCQVNSSSEGYYSNSVKKSFSKRNYYILFYILIIQKCVLFLHDKGWLSRDMRYIWGVYKAHKLIY